MRLDSLNPLSSLISTTMSVKSAVYCSLVVLASLVLAPEPVRSAQATLKDQGVKPTPFPVCIDDSDCSKLGQGTKYACFQVRKTLNSGKLIIFYEIVWIKREVDPLIAQLFQPQHSSYFAVSNPQTHLALTPIAKLSYQSISPSLLLTKSCDLSFSS